MIVNKIADRITKVLKILPKNDLVTNEEQNIGLGREIHRERYIEKEYIEKESFVRGTTTITGAGADDAAKRVDERNKGVISEINNIQIDNVKDIDVVIPMYNLIEYSDKYSKESGNSWQYYRDEPANKIQDSESFKSKIKIIGHTSDDGNSKNVEMSASLKYLSNFWRTLQMPPRCNNRYKTLCSWCNFMNSK